LTEKEKSTQKINDSEVLELARIGKQIEDHYKFPQDTEWAIEDGKVYFVQARPVTTIKKTAKKTIPLTVETESGSHTVQAGAPGEQLLKGVPASVGIATGPVQIIVKIEEIESFKEGNILVAEMTNPSYVPAMRKAAAIVTDAGGMTSHAAIISRELGIPAIVGTTQATHLLKDGQVITVDGAKGLVYKGSVEKATIKQDHIQTSTVPNPGFVEEIPITATKVYVNLAEPEEAKTVSKLPVDGVGLLRAEFMIAGLQEHPKAMLKSGQGKKFVDSLTDGILEIANAFKPHPIVYRATDFKTNEYRGLPGGEKFEPQEENPMLGFRGALRYITDPEVFALEIETLKNVREKFGATNVHLMIPFVRTVEELRKIKEMLATAGLKNDGKNFKLWIMVEVPSTVFLIDKFCEEGIDGVSIGSNDLTQLILGVDRDNGTLASSFDERNEAVLLAMQRVVAVTRKYGVTCSICGNAASLYPEVIEPLVRAGITSVSVTPDAVLNTKKLIASIEKRILLDK
jgi:pyruvate,water dikinase